MAYRKKTVAEKMGEKPKAVADFVKKIRKNLNDVKVPDNTHLRDVKNWGMADAGRWIGEVTGQTLKLSGVSLLWLTEYLTRGFGKLFVDNKLVRELEQFAEKTAKKQESAIDPKTGKKNGETKLSRFVKKNPWVMGYLTYWSMLVATAGGAFAVGEAVMPDDKDAPKKEVRDATRSRLIITDANGETIDASKEIVLNPASPEFINQCIALENITCIPIIYTETYRAEPIVQPKENVYTHGWGMTWSRDKNGRMKVRDYADTPANRRNGLKPHKPKKSANKDVDIAETQQFLIDQVYPLIQRHMKRPITENEFYAICAAGYQLTGHIDEICKKLNDAKTPQQIADAFITPNYDKYGGTPKRRWVCAMLAAGYITMQDILNADVDNFYKADVTTMVRNGHFVTNENTIKYVLGLSGSQKTSAVVRETADGRLAIQQLGGYAPAKVVASVETAEDKSISESMSLLLQAGTEYRAGRLEQAAQLYEQAIEKDPDNMQAYSSLSLTYKKLGDKNKSIDYYEKSIAFVKEGNNRMNANKTLLLDRDVKAASYYNAGAAREEMAKIYKNKGNQTEARRNYELAIRNYKTALENVEMGGLGAKRKQSYQDAINRATRELNAMGGRSKRQALNNGTKKMRQQNARADLLLYGETYKGNMA